MRKKTLGIVAMMLIVCSSALQGEESVPATDSAAARAAEQEYELEYLELVMKIFRYHVKALALLTSQGNENSRYSDNVVRHASAIWHTSGFLDHIYLGDGGEADQEWPWKNQKDFEKLVEANRKAAKQLKKAAGNWLKDRDREKFTQSLEELKSSCRDCHGESRNWP